MKVGNIEGQVNNLWSLVYDSGELGSAVSSLTISGLDGNNDEEYIMLYRFINGYNGANVFYFRPNNDTTNTNYRYQIYYASNTTKTAARGTPAVAGFGLASTDAQNELGFGILSLYAKSGQVRTVSLNRLDVTTSTINQFLQAGYMWANTADNITSITVVGDNTDSIGIGSRVIILKKVTLTTGFKTGVLNIEGKVKGNWKKVYENTLTSAASSITISSLTGNTDIIYRLRIRQLGGSSTANLVAIRPNNDGDANYWRQWIDATNTTLEASRQTNASAILTNNNALTAQNAINDSEFLIFSKSGYRRGILQQSMQNGTSSSIGGELWSGWIWNNTADEITSLVIICSQTNGLGIGTYICLEKLCL